MTMKTIKNVTHDLLPIVSDISEQLLLLNNVKNASDHIKLLHTAKNNVLLIEKYLLALDKEAQENGIKKA
jgi:hypothetical protein